MGIFRCILSILEYVLQHLNKIQENISSDMCAQPRYRSACAFSQSDQNLHCGILIAKEAKFLHGDNDN